LFDYYINSHVFVVNRARDTAAVCVAAHISDREKAWKLEFSEWTTRYIVDWKTQYDLYVNRLQRGDGCTPPT